MSPIEGLTNVTRLPRLGKIRLGIRVEEPKKSPYPRATDHFVVPPEVAKVYTQKPTELEIMFPLDDPEVVAQQWLRRYSLTQGLVCIGDGAKARRKVDSATGDFAGHETRHWEWKDNLDCDPDECPEYQSKRCRRVMNLQFLLPDVPGLGIWQIDTTSRNSIVNINNMIRIVRDMTGGRLAFIPLTLALGPISVFPPGEKTKIVHCLHLKSDVKLRDVVKAATLPAPRVLLPEADTEEPPGDLFPPEVLAEAPEQEPEVVAEAEPTMDDLLGEGPDDGAEDAAPLDEEPDGVAFTPATTKQIETLRCLAPQAGYKTWETFKLWAVKQYNLASFDELTLDQAEDAMEKLQEIRRRRQEF